MFVRLGQAASFKFIPQNQRLPSSLLDRNKLLFLGLLYHKSKLLIAIYCLSAMNRELIVLSTLNYKWNIIYLPSRIISPRALKILDAANLLPIQYSCYSTTWFLEMLNLKRRWESDCFQIFLCNISFIKLTVLFIMGSTLPFIWSRSRSYGYLKFPPLPLNPTVYISSLLLHLSLTVLVVFEISHLDY